MPESEAIRILAGSVDKLAANIAAEKQARRQMVIGLGVVIVMVAILAAVGTAVNWHQLQVQKTDRTAARVVACESYNTDTAGRINSNFIAAARASDNPDALERVVPLLMPLRDCSKTGIDDYFDGNPDTDPFIPVTIEDIE